MLGHLPHERPVQADKTDGPSILEKHSLGNRLWIPGHFLEDHTGKTKRENERK